ncbi:MAG: hypothetical protein GW823_00175 [Bacteroidetes bacterium]|nr:hypothetical protein [Bacteroidota bacterium]
MKKYLYIIPTIFFFQFSNGQHICSYSNNDFDLYEIINSVQNYDDDIKEIVNLITDIYGGYPNFILQRVEGKGNCYAIMKDDLRFIVYDRDFLQYHAKVSQTNKLAVIFIMAHEIGHHINGHIRVKVNEPDKRKTELEADYFAGFILGKLKASKNDIKNILDLTGFDLFTYSATHPARIDRIASAYEGFDSANLAYEIDKSEVVNSLVISTRQIASNIEDNSNKKATTNKINPSSIRGKAFKNIYKFSNPENWYVSAYSDVIKSETGCFIYQIWNEDYSYKQAPSYIRNDPGLMAMAVSDTQGQSYASLDILGNNAFVYIINSTTQRVIRRTKNIFNTKKKIKNTSDKIFPEDVWTNNDKTKLLYITENHNNKLQYKATFIDLVGYQKVYECLPENEKKKYINPERVIALLADID